MLQQVLRHHHGGPPCRSSHLRCHRGTGKRSGMEPCLCTSDRRSGRYRGLQMGQNKKHQRPLAYCEDPIYRTWSNIPLTGHIGHLPACTPNHPLPAAVCLLLPERQPQAIHMAHGTPSPRTLHHQLHGAQGDTIKGEDHRDLHHLAHSALLCHLRRRPLGPESIIHINCGLRDRPYPVVQDTEVNLGDGARSPTPG